jgi:ATP diphosphatase
MVSRHPHVFTDFKFDTDKERQHFWDEEKENEKKAKNNKNIKESILSGVPKNLPALMQCEKIQDKAAHHGFDWPEVEPVFDKVLEELGEVKEAWQEKDQVHIQEEMGDLLLVVVNLARHLNINPEIALKEGNKKFTKRFNYIEEQVELSGRELRDCSLAELDKYWDEAKRSNLSGDA